MIDKKIIFMGTPATAATYLNSLLDNQYNIISVFTQPPRNKDRGMKVKISPVHKLASQYNIPVHTPARLDEEACKSIIFYKPDLIIVMAYGQIFPTNIINFPKYGCINVHVSLLPRWRGASPIEHTLLNGDNETGVTIFKLVEKLDSGPILTQDTILVEKNINKGDLLNKLTKLGSNLLINILPKLFVGKIIMKIQSDDKATYAHKINSQMRKINFKLSSNQVINQIRAYSPKPGAWFIYKKERIKIISASIQNIKGIPATIISNKFELGCLDGSISPLYLQREGKKIMHIEDFLRGFSFKVGDSINA